MSGAALRTTSSISVPIMTADEGATSDARIAVLRRIFWRELDAVRAGSPTKAWRGLAHPSELPRQEAQLAGG